MKPNLIIFERENVNNDYITFSDRMKPRVKYENLSDSEMEKLLERRAEILQKIEAVIYECFLDEQNNDSLASDGDWFPDRTVLTGNYYIGTESYLQCFKGKNGHPYDIKNGKYRDLWEQDADGHCNSFLPLDSDEITRGYQIIIEVRMTSCKNGKEADYLGVDLTAEFDSLDEELDFEILGTDCI